MSSTKALSENSTINELFETIRVDRGVNVVPVTVSQEPANTRLLIALQGEHDTASTIMALLMSAIDEIHERQAQQEASESDEPESTISPA